jgi:predicted ATPase
MVCHGLAGEAQRLNEQRLACLERRIELDLALGRHADLTGELAALVGEHPLRERLVEHQMVALYRCGRRLEALDAFNATRVRLAEQTGLDPRPELSLLHRAILTGAPAVQSPSVSAAADSGSVQAQLPGLPRRILPRFIGRRRDLFELPSVLQDHAVVTLTGPPGSGKTRLALEVAAAAAPSFAAGVALIALDTVRDAGGVAPALLTVLEPLSDPWRAPQENLIRVLANRTALLVLDSCENVAAECARLLGALAAECPGLRVLATSQVPLGVAIERVYRVRPLSTPADGTVAAVEASESGRLLVDRATRVDPGFALTDANAAQVARLCRSVEGLPLALELAAGRLRAFSVGQIADRLDSQLELLASRPDAMPADAAHTVAERRHGSLRAAIDWSYDLLTDRERTVFARLSVFVGGFTLEAAEAVVSDEDLSEATVTDTLGSLVERSLVVAEPREDPRGDMRYRLLDALREYAAVRLDELGDADAVRQRHARYFCDFSEQAEGERRGPVRRRWLRWLGEEYANLRAAMAWSQSRGEHMVSLRYACALTWFWRRFATREALEWLRQVIPAAVDAPAGIRQRALISAGSLALRVSIDEARNYVQQAILLARARGDRRTEIVALSLMASVEVYPANAMAVGDYGEEAVELARTNGDPYLLARTLMARGLTQAHIGDPNRTGSDLTEALALFTKLEDRLGMHEVRMARAEVACASGDIEGARSALAQIGTDEVAAFPSTGTAPYWLCRSWLALREGRHNEVRLHLRQALGEIIEEFAGPYAAQRIFGPALDLAAGLAAAERDLVRAVTIHHAATAVLTLGGAVPERPQVRWATEVDALATAALDPDEYAAAAAQGSRMRLTEALAYARLPIPADREP